MSRPIAGYGYTRPQKAVFGLSDATSYDLPIYRQAAQSGVGSSTRTATFGSLPLAGSLLIAVSVSENATPGDPSGGGCSWRMVVDNSISGMNNRVYIGVVGSAIPSTSVTLSAGTAGVGVVEFRNLKGAVIEILTNQSSSALGPVKRIPAGRGIAYALSAHRNFSPTMVSWSPMDGGDLLGDSMAGWLPLSRAIATDWSAGGTNRTQTMLAIL